MLAKTYRVCKRVVNMRTSQPLVVALIKASSLTSTSYLRIKEWRNYKDWTTLSIRRTQIRNGVYFRDRVTPSAKWRWAEIFYLATRRMWIRPTATETTSRALCTKWTKLCSLEIVILLGLRKTQSMRRRPSQIVFTMDGADRQSNRRWSLIQKTPSLRSTGSISPRRRRQEVDNLQTTTYQSF